MLLELQEGVTYGPVASRRLGRSLGINLLPELQKLCTFDCLYCQYGWSDGRLLSTVSPEDFPSIDQVLAAVEDTVSRLASPPAYLTFSGNGEPTLHPRFAEIVEGVTEIRNRLCPEALTAVLSNSSRVHDPNIRHALSRLDRPIMKLDAGNNTVLQRFNQPVEPLDHGDLVEGLRALRRVTIQALFAAGPGGNSHAEHLWAWVDTVAAVGPEEVQLYTLDRGYPSRQIQPVSAQTLEAIHDWLASRNIPSTVF